jgi:hypothetical protein
MSEQDRVDSPEHDDVEAHKHRHMTDDADSTTASDDVEAHRGPKTAHPKPAATQEPDSDDDVEAHRGPKTAHPKAF